MSSKGRTELQISLSGAKNAEEVAGDVQKFVAPQKTGKNIEKLHEIFEKKNFFFGDFFFAESIRMYPNVSECVKTGPNRPENVEKLRENIENIVNTTRRPWRGVGQASIRTLAHHASPINAGL